MGLEGRRALITGGTAGISAEAARLFVADGAEEIVEWGEGVNDLGSTMPIGGSFH